MPRDKLQVPARQEGGGGVGMSRRGRRRPSLSRGRRSWGGGRLAGRGRLLGRRHPRLLVQLLLRRRAGAELRSLQLLQVELLSLL